MAYSMHAYKSSLQFNRDTRKSGFFNVLQAFSGKPDFSVSDMFVFTAEDNIILGFVIVVDCEYK